MTDTEKKLLQAQHRLEEAQARDRVKESKARTRRLIQEGAILEIQVTTPDGKTITSNLKVTKEDLEMLQTIREMQQNQ